MFQKPLRVLRNFCVSQAGVRFADCQQFSMFATYRKSVVREHLGALSMTPFDGDDHNVERRQLAFEFEPPFSAPSGMIRRVGALEHDAFVSRITCCVEFLVQFFG